MSQYLSESRRRRVVQRLVVRWSVDMVAWCVALSFATLARLDFEAARVDWRGLLAALPLVMLLHSLSGGLCGLYVGRWRYGSFDEVTALARSTILAMAALFVTLIQLDGPRLVPLSACLGGGIAALTAMSASRYVWRLKLERERRPRATDATRTLVFGAGDAGVRFVTAMLGDRNSTYLPVGLLDDDPAKRRLRILGVPVLGDRTSIGRAGEATSAEVVLIAVATADASLITAVTNLAEASGLAIKVLPPLAELLDDELGVGDIRDVRDEDLLGRRPVDTDICSISQYLTGKRVLVTGAGGSIGSEICRQVHRLAPEQLVMLDRDESALHAVQLSIEGRALLDSPDVVLNDIRDVRHLREVFETYRPHVVLHAAALKHLSLLERFPGQAVQTNVWGTLSVLEAAMSVGVELFVNISTDKAADPISVLGYSKRLAERLTSHAAKATPTGNFISVRFGNVLGSRGSVLGAFQAQILAGGPLTVTDPNVTRYFMTIPEAVQLVIQAGAVGRDGEVLVLDMGQPVRISDIATRLTDRSPRPVQIEYTGLRPGEKMHEARMGIEEEDSRPFHPLISHCQVPPLDPQRARLLDPWTDEHTVVIQLRDACSDVVSLPDSRTFDRDQPRAVRR
jgi:FlaA1/EpsC-like NDP-sugar epimerase